MNVRLREALLRAGIAVDVVAARCAVDPKTVGRWLTTDRTPHPRHRETVADLLGMPPEELWPSVGVQHHPGLWSLSAADVLAVYPDRSSVPRSEWLRLLEAATRNVDFLVHSGTFLAQSNPRIASMLLRRAAAGVQVRLCFGDPLGSAVALRGEEEGIGSTLGAKVRTSMTYFNGLREAEGCHVRLHDTALYASIFRFDDQAMINPHVWGSPASANPVFHVKQGGEDSMFGKYLDSFEKIWDKSSPWSLSATESGS